MINLLPEMTPTELLNASHNFTGKPAIIFIAIFASIIYMFSIYFVMDSNKVDWSKLGLSFILFIFLLAIAVTFLFMCPNTIQSLFGWVSN